MPTNISEMNLEDMTLAYLRDKQGYEEGTTNDYVKDYALDTERVKRFLLSTQNRITGSVLLITARNHGVGSTDHLFQIAK